MADLMERAACLRAAIRAATEALEGKHQRSELAIQLRAHLAELQKMERELCAPNGVEACGGEVFSPPDPDAPPSQPE